MSTTTTKPVPAKKENGFKFGFATLVLLGLVSGASQFVAASIFGIAEYFAWDVRSTGGLVAVIAGIVMWVRCRSWASWRKWVWVPILVTVTLSSVFMGVTAQSIAREEAVLRQDQELRQEEEARQAGAAQACQDLWQEIEAKDGIDASPPESSVEQPSWDSGAEKPSWASAAEKPSWESGPSQSAWTSEVDQLRAEYDASC